jgi:hypothetical protein
MDNSKIKKIVNVIGRTCNTHWRAEKCIKTSGLKGPLEMPRCRKRDNIKIKVIRWDGVGWIQLA